MKIKELEQYKKTTYWSKGEEIPFACWYVGKSYRWEESANPIIVDEEVFKTEDEAIEYVNGLKLDVGFRGVVDKVEFELSDYDQEDSIDDVKRYDLEAEEVYSTDVFEGEDITGAIIIRWSWEKYVGYARNLLDIGVAGEYPFHDLKTEQDLITGNEESTFGDNYSVLVSAEDVKNCSIEEELNSGWKWNYFKNNPSSFKEEILEISANLSRLPC